MNIAERNAIIEYVREWVNENTYSQDDFSDIGDLVDLKRGKNVRISVGIPTLNEGKTIC